MFTGGIIADDRSTSFKLEVDFNSDKANTHWGYSLQTLATTGGDSTPGSIEPLFIELNGIKHEIWRFINQPFTSGTALWVLGGTQNDSNNIVLSQDSITSVATNLGVLTTADLGSSDTIGAGLFTSFDIAGGRKMNRWQWVSEGTGTSGANPTLPNIIGNYAHSTFLEVVV